MEAVGAGTYGGLGIKLACSKASLAAELASPFTPSANTPSLDGPATADSTPASAARLGSGFERAMVPLCCAVYALIVGERERDGLELVDGRGGRGGESGRSSWEAAMASAGSNATV